MLCRACGTTVVPPYQRPGTGLTPETDDHPRGRPDNDSVTNLAKNLTDTTRVHAGRVAVRVDNAAMTYRALDEASARVAGLLRERGLKPGDRIGIMMPNVAEVPVVYYGILRAGGVVVPMNPLLKAREVAYYLGDSGARLVFAWHTFAEQARGGADQVEAESIVVDEVGFPALLASATPDFGVADTADEDTAVILYTSGTTGHPKGAELTHGNLISNTDVTRTDIVGARPDDVIFGGLPLFHVFGQTVALNVAVAAGACLTLLPRFDAEHALRIVAGHRVTVFEGVPTMYVALLHQPNRADYDTSSLRMCISGGAALPVEVLRGFEEAYNVPVLEGYGLSETSPVASFNHPDREHKPGSIGTPIRDVRMRLVDGEGHEVARSEVGEIAISGPNVMKGYWQRPEATAEAIRDGWFHTGDLARADEDGYYFIVDRKKDLIIRGGYNVYPREIEEVLYEHPADRRGGRHRPAAPVPGRGGRRRGGPQAGRRRQRRGTARLRQGPGRGVQVPAARVDRRHAAQGADRQDPEAGHSRPARPDHVG